MYAYTGRIGGFWQVSRWLLVGLVVAGCGSGVTAVSAGPGTTVLEVADTSASTTTPLPPSSTTTLPATQAWADQVTSYLGVQPEWTWLAGLGIIRADDPAAPHVPPGAVAVTDTWDGRRWTALVFDVTCDPDCWQNSVDPEWALWHELAHLLPAVWGLGVPDERKAQCVAEVVLGRTEYGYSPRRTDADVAAGYWDCPPAEVGWIKAWLEPQRPI